MKVALYARVSLEEVNNEGRLQDPENQLEPMRKYCDAMGWKISEEFVDRASGGNSNRPRFQDMLARVKQRHFDLILVWALDRFSREGMSNTLGYIKKLRNYKTGLRSMQESWLDTTQEGVGDLLIGIFSWVAAEERRRISERVKAGIKRVRLDGRKWGRPRKTPPTVVYKEKDGSS